MKIKMKTWTACVLASSIAAAAFLVSCGEKRGMAVKNAFGEFTGKYVLFVSKRDFVLYVYDRDLKVVKKFPIAFGLNPDRKPKLYRGDNRTPEGTYRVTEMLSMDADRSTASYRKLRAMNAVFWRARDGHGRFGDPRADLGDNAYGPRFFLLSFPGEGDRQRYREALKRNEIPFQGGAPVPIGHGIAIHGNNDPESIGHLATSGCVRMYNNDIIELERYVMEGTVVIISPD